MATNPLYLNTFPSTEKEHKVELTLVKGQSDTNVSLSEFMNQMCAMVQLLHLVEGELVLNQSKLTAEVNDAAEVNVIAVTSQGKLAVENAQKALEAEESSWWKKLLMGLLAVVMVALSYFTFGITGVVLGAITLLLTAVPIPALGGKTLMGALASKIAEAYGTAHGWSQAKIQEVTGIINIVGAVLLAAATFGAGTLSALAEVTEVVATVVEDVAVEMTDMAAGNAVTDTVEEVVDTVVEDTANAAAKASLISGKAVKFGFSAFAGINAFVSQVTNSNCISDIMMGALMNANPNASDKEKETIAGIAAALNILVAIFGAIAGGKIAMSALPEELAEGSSFISKIVSKLGISAENLEKIVGVTQLGVAGLEGGTNIYQGFTEIEIGELNAIVTRLTGGLKSSEELSKLLNLTINQINGLMKDFADEYKTLESGLKNIGMYDSAEVSALLKGHQQA